jgi:hypothetical protein
MPANPNFDDIVTTTLRNRSGKLADNATETTVLLDRLRRRGKVKPAAGGRTIVQELEVSLNPNAGWFAGYDTLNTNVHEPFSAAEYDWKQAYVPVVWSGLEKLKNMGEFEVIDLIGSRVQNAEKSLYDLVAQASYSAGTGSGGKQMHGLGLFVVNDPTTGTVGGISRADNTFWRNQVISVTLSATVGPNLASANPSGFLSAINQIAIACTRGTDHPDLYVADGTAYRFYLESLQPIQRVTSTELAGYGFTALKYYGVGGNADFALDNGYCPDKTVFALNTSYLYLRPHPDRNFTAMGGDRVPVNQDATVRFLGFAGNMCASNLFLQGRVVAHQ